MNFNNEGYMEFEASYTVFGTMTFLLFSVLLSCCFSLAYIRYRSQKEGKAQIKLYQQELEQIKVRASSKAQLLNASSSPYVVTPQQKFLKSQENKAHGPQPIETRPQDLAGIVSFLAEHPDEDEDIEFRPAYKNALLVHQQKSRID